MADGVKTEAAAGGVVGMKTAAVLLRSSGAQVWDGVGWGGVGVLWLGLAGRCGMCSQTCSALSVLCTNVQ